MSWQTRLAAMLLAALSALGEPQASVDEQVRAHSRQAQEYLKNNQAALAAKEFAAIVGLNPNNLEAQGNLGVLLFAQGNFAEAALHLRAALPLKPTPWKIQALLGMCERRLGQMADARSDLEASFAQLKEKKIRVQTGMELVELYYGAGALDKAASTVSTLRQLEPTDIDILYTAHRIYSDLADESMLSMAMLGPDSARMHQLMAHEAARQGNRQGAIEQYRKALSMDPNIPGLHFELAEALSGSSVPSDRDEIEKEYKAALAANPFDEKSECRLGEIAAHQSDFKSALAHFSKALKLQPDDADANLGLAKVLISTGEPQKALPLLQRAAQLDPYNAVIHYHLSAVYRKTGRTADAQRELAEFRKMRGMKSRLTQVYEAMRLQLPEQERPDEDVPK
ncbi:MAG TPA: tetratricopeptide repeat protein [Bryobacteraceae bacterium]